MDKVFVVFEHFTDDAGTFESCMEIFKERIDALLCADKLNYGKGRSNSLVSIEYFVEEMELK